MPFIATTPPEEADGAVAAMYLRQQAAWGYVPNYAKAFCHRPEVMARWGRLLAEIKRPMDKRRFELVTFAAAVELASSACALVHGKRLREFFTDDDIVAMAADRLAGVALTAAERAMLRFARQVVRDASKITLAQVDELKHLGLTDAEVFDVAATAAGRAFFAKLLDALGVEPDRQFLEVDAALREALTVGRTIDTSACATMPAQQQAVSTQ
jgi:uncharacterized peroxidase-related enzyme